jgi:hypothetical protein
LAFDVELCPSKESGNAFVRIERQGLVGETGRLGYIEALDDSDIIPE